MLITAKKFYVATGLALALSCSNENTPPVTGGAGASAGMGTGASAGMGTGASAGMGTGASAGSGQGGAGASASGGNAGSGQGGGPPVEGMIIGSAAANAFKSIPASALDAARSQLRFFYGHLSHGDQVLNGMDMLHGELGAAYSYSDSFMGEFYGSCDPGRPPIDWAGETRTQLAAGNYNVVMWAFSSNLGEISRGGTEAYVQSYLTDMQALEAQYPNVTFVYFTGPAKTDASLGSTMATNNQTIRSFAQANNKVLFDFEDIELTDPGGTRHSSGTDACEWCDSWCSAHPADCNGCNYCSDGCGCEAYNHTDCFQCYRKGQAFWYLAARLAGWAG